MLTSDKPKKCNLILRQKTLLASQRERVTAEAVWELTLGKGLMP